MWNLKSYDTNRADPIVAEAKARLERALVYGGPGRSWRERGRAGERGISRDEPGGPGKEGGKEINKNNLFWLA